MSNVNRNFINPVVADLPPSGIRKFFDLVSEMTDVISLGIGEPDFVTPWRMREACIYSLEKGYTMYTANLGLPDLRREISVYTSRHFGVEYDPAREILVTVGGSEAMDLAVRAVLSPGDEIIIPEPCFVSYGPCAIIAGGKVVYIPTYVEDGFKVEPEKIKNAITPYTKALFIGYPNNPTGAVMDRETLLAISRLAAEYDLAVISDEIYSRLVYDCEHVCFAALPDMKERTILLNGFSKAYAMTGWRLGYALAPPEIIEAMNKIHQYTIMCAPITAQKAAIEALRNGEKDCLYMVEQYDQRRRVFISGLNAIGLDCFEPRGAFYAFPSVKRTGMSSQQFAEELLREERVAVVPGTAFGPSGEGYVRCSYASSMENLQEALRRMENFVKKHR
ncbi:MAG: aminotransferase class I/II-fold pyridoxal phosphate-dependent enzyme [Bacillota bacterium]